MYRILLPLFLTAGLATPSLAQDGVIEPAPAPLSLQERQDPPPFDPPAPLVGGAVKKTEDGLCIEPGHPRYEESAGEERHPSMRACVASGGRRDVRQDPLSLNSSQDTLTEDTSPGTPPEMPQEDFSPLPSDRLGGRIISPFSALRERMEFDEGPGPAFQAPAAEEAKPAAPIIRPRGIELTDTPSYSSPSVQSKAALEETCARRGYTACIRAFQEPAEYIGRSPRSFLP